LDYIIPRAVWLADIASNFSPYLAIAFALILLVAAAKRARVALIGAAIGLVAALSPIVRDAPSARASLAGPTHRDTAARLKVMTFNLQDINQHYAEVLKYLVESPADVIFLNEAFYVWRVQLAKLIPSFPWNSLRYERDLVVLSRIPLERVDFVNLDGDRGRGLLVQARVGEGTVALLGAHARKPRHVSDFRLRSRQLDQIAEIVSAQPGPLVVAGDFNATSRSFAMQTFLETTGLQPLGWRWPPLSTWPSWLPYLGLQIDHVLTKGPVEVVEAETGPNLGSNHLPLIAELRIAPARAITP
jgi:endonuclease/exonuclease/phosphatase (EEP) superfamily protein YafD